jgi:predicted ATPase
LACSEIIDVDRSTAAHQKYEPVALKMVLSSRADLIRSLALNESLASLNVETGSNDHLGLDNLELRGRTKEIAELKAAYARIREASESKLVMVHGDSGTGKSTIIDVLGTFVTETKGYYVKGKFEQGRADPFAALLAAANDLCDLILHGSDLDARRQALKAALGFEAEVLCTLIPRLQDLLDIELTDQRVISIGQGVVRLKLLFRTFCQAVSTPECPVCWFLDDIQWATEGDLEIIKGLLTDTKLKHTLIVASYRDDEMKQEVLDKYFYTRNFDDDRSGSHTFRVGLINVLLTNLDLDQVNQLVAEATKTEDTSLTLPLSRIVLQRTGGNPYFTKVFLDSLQLTGLLRLQPDGTWEWDVNAVKAETEVSDNVLNVLTAKVMTLPEQVQAILQLASYLGYKFSANLLEAIVADDTLNASNRTRGDERMKTVSPVLQRERISRALGVALNEGLLEKEGDKYWFTHDKVQQCLYSIIDDERERDLLHLRIGRVVQDMLLSSSTTEDDLIFLATDNLNTGSQYVTEVAEIEALARLNLRAAQLAVEKSAFSLAVEYLRSAIGLLDENRWHKHYDFCVQLYSTAAEVEHCTGHYVRCSILIAEVHREARCLADRFRVYFVEVDSLGSRGNLPAALKLGFRILQKLGERTPLNPTKLHIMYEFITMRKAISGQGEERLTNLPAMENPTTIATMRILSSLALYSYFMFSDRGQNAFIFVLLRAARLSLKYGACNLTPFAIAGYGIVLTSMGKYVIAAKYANLAVKMFEMLPNKEMEARTSILSIPLTLLWTNEVKLGLEQMQRSFQLAVVSADIDYAYFSPVVYATCAAFTGLPMGKTLDYLRTCTAEGEEFNLSLALSHLRCNWQFMLNLSGRVEDPCVLTGEAMVEEDVLAQMIATGDTNLAYSFYFCSLGVHCHFANWDNLAKILPNIRRSMKAGDAFYGQVFLYLYLGFSYMELYRNTHTRSYLSHFRRVLNRTKRWVHQGAVNAIPVYKILCAEQNSTAENAEEQYLAAIASALEAGLLPFAALATEKLAGALESRGLEDSAARHIVSAINLYKSWEAHGKVSFLQKRHRKLLAKCKP